MSNKRPAPNTTPPRPVPRPEPTHRDEDTEIRFTSWDAPLVPR